jgi:hypothetical protein
LGQIERDGDVEVELIPMPLDGVLRHSPKITDTTALGKTGEFYEIFRESSVYLQIGNIGESN